MSKVAVVYWSGTGNTEAHGHGGAEGAKGKGAEVSVITAAEFSPEQVSEYSAIAFGCPSMGSEQLEESEFEPMFTACEGRLSGKISPCSAPTAGAMANDAQLGVPLQTTTAPIWPVTA